MSATARAFNQAVKKQNPAVFDYAREVKRVWRDFPQTKESVLFLDICMASGQELIYPDGRDSKSKQKKLRLIAGNACLQSVIMIYRCVEHSSCCAPGLGGYSAILLYTEKHSDNFLSSTALLAQETVFAFDHELGHVIIPNAAYADGDENLAECIADAYAVIRHFQRYGADSGAVDELVRNRSFGLIFGSAGPGRSHFTSPVVEQILAKRYDIDWDSLTPYQTTQLARRFAMEHAMHSIPLRDIDRGFSPLHDGWYEIEHGEDSPLRALAKKVLTTDSSNIFKYGSSALQLCLDKGIANIILTGKYWDNVRQKLAEKQKCFKGRDKFLFGLGVRLPQTTAANSNAVKAKFPSVMKR